MTKTIEAEQFGQVLDEVRRTAPPVGLAALSGKTPNHALKQAWGVLNDAGVELVRGPMNYRWRALRKANPRLAHSIEEVLVFGDSLFTVIGQKQSPESLKSEFIELKQRFAKIIKETEALAMPKEEKKLFSFFDKTDKTAAQKTELRLDALDTLLEETHGQSRQLLDKTEKDLLAERSFHRAVEWYILALEDAQKMLKDASAAGSLVMDGAELTELNNALGVAEITTRSNMSTSDKFLKIKESLHNKSITFLTAHENTFTVIQSHLRSWKDIKEQTDALNALSETVKVGSALMSSASVGVEGVMKNWSPSFVSAETISSLTQSFGDYDKDVSTLVEGLTTAAPSTNVVSHWDQWEQTKKNIVDPALAGVTQRTKEETAVYRPTLRKTAKPLEEAIVEQPIPVNEEVATVVPFAFTQHPWNALDQIVAQKALQKYSAEIGINFSVQQAQQMGWTAVETVARANAPLLAVEGLSALPLAVRSEIDYRVKHGQPLQTDWHSLVEQKVLVPTADDWKETFVAWMGAKDDLDWAYLMQWNDLVYDLLIFEHDNEQKMAVLSGATTDDEKIKASLQERIEEFASSPGISSVALKEWGFAGLITLYAVALDMPTPTIDKLWTLWHNPKQPVDWNEEFVSNWNNAHASDMQTNAGKHIQETYLTDAPQIATSEPVKKIKQRRAALADTPVAELKAKFKG